MLFACVSQLSVMSYDYWIINPIIKTSSYGNLAKKPNIYFFLVDALPRKDIIELLPSGAKFIESFENRGFAVSEISHSNYLGTTLSVSSEFMMEYHKNNDCIRSMYKMQCGKNNVMATVRANGYEYCYMNNRCSPEFAFVIPEVDHCVTLENDIINMTGAAFRFFVASLLKQSVFAVLSSKINRLDVLKYAYLEPQDVENFIRAHPHKKPLMVFSHFMQVHDMSITEKGVIKNGCCFFVRDKKSFAKLLTSVEDMGRKIKDVSDFIIKNDPSAIIIVQGDHGTLFAEDGSFALKESLNARARNFFAIRFGDDMKTSRKIVANTFSVVNVFRNIFRELGIQIYAIPDKIYLNRTHGRFGITFSEINKEIYSKEMDKPSDEYIKKITKY